jgi:hypothetical protein
LPDEAGEGRSFSFFERLRGGLGAKGVLMAGIPGVSAAAVWASARTVTPPVIVVACAVVVVAASVVAIYRSRQETRRKEIDLHPVNTLADALARSLDDSHRAAPCSTPEEEIAEAERVRRSALKMLAMLGDSLITELATKTHEDEPADHDHA